MKAIINTAMIGFNTLEEPKEFFDSVFSLVNWKSTYIEASFQDNAKLKGVSYTEDGQKTLMIVIPSNGQPATSANGSQVSIRCDSISIVDMLHAQAIKQGAENLGSPGRRPSGFYQSYFREPFIGHKIVIGFYK